MFSGGRDTCIAPQKLEVSEFCSIFLLAVNISSSSDRALRSLLLRVPREFVPGPQNCRESSILNQASQKLISRIRISVVTPSQGIMTTSILTLRTVGMFCPRSGRGQRTGDGCERYKRRITNT